FVQAEDGIRDRNVTGVQTCALPISYARVGYHRGLDALRAAGWRGAGPIPYAHEVNRGFLRALYALGRAAGSIGEGEEAARIEERSEERRVGKEWGCGRSEENAREKR